ncbi:MAG TPA: glycoside hydrolase family 88 protein [Bacteroidota bacterium]|nr:glycoside hydrolase family 88 protein [Bacteroidota bacterium]
MKNRFLLIFLLLPLFVAAAGAGAPGEVSQWSARMAGTFLKRHPGGVTFDSLSPSQKWNYEQGLMLEALHQMWVCSGDPKYLDFIKANIDRYVGEDGRIRTYAYDEFTLDNIAPGRALLFLYDQTHDRRYMIAADTLRSQLRHQPRTAERGFWHKKIYPNQMWLDGLYMAEPFYAQYARETGEQADFADIIDQFVLIARHTTDSVTGLLYHGWDATRTQQWADPETGCSPCFWGRAMGWYSMGLVDVLGIIPDGYPRRDTLVTILRNLTAALLKRRDPATGLWYQIVDQRGKDGNYLEASASCMFTYTLAKGASRGYLPREDLAAAESTFASITRQFVVADDKGDVNLLHTCQSAGLGGHPYRDGSFDYYIREPQRTNDLKGLGSFLLAAIEIEQGRAGTIR